MKDFLAVAHRYLGPWLRERAGTGSHSLIVAHPALAYHSAFEGYGTFSVPSKSGRRIKGVYVDHLIKAIDCITDWEDSQKQKEEGEEL